MYTLSDLIIIKEVYTRCKLYVKCNAITQAVLYVHNHYHVLMSVDQPIIAV